jgi:hypothetical protein
VWRFLPIGLLLTRSEAKSEDTCRTDLRGAGQEDADFLEFCDRIDEIPSDPELALAMEDGEVDFFNNDPFVGVKLYRA